MAGKVAVVTGAASGIGEGTVERFVAEGARVVVANDTGTAHVAAAAARPMLVICGPTDPRRVRPLGEQVRTLQASLPCINCYAKTCSHHSCMREVTVEYSITPLGATAVGFLDELRKWSEALPRSVHEGG